LNIGFSATTENVSVNATTAEQAGWLTGSVKSGLTEQHYQSRDIRSSGSAWPKCKRSPTLLMCLSFHPVGFEPQRSHDWQLASIGCSFSPSRRDLRKGAACVITIMGTAFLPQASATDDLPPSRADRIKKAEHCLAPASNWVC
jgi:hypothetical protein